MHLIFFKCISFENKLNIFQLNCDVLEFQEFMSWCCSGRQRGSGRFSIESTAGVLEERQRSAAGFSIHLDSR